MKKILFLLAFLIVIVHISSAQFDERKMLYINKVKTYRKMRNIGVSMIGLGVIGTVAGISVVSNEVNRYNATGQMDDSRANLGVACVMLGIPVTAGGTVLGIIGHHKVKKYLRKMENVTLNVNYSPQSKAIAIRYRF